MAIMRMSQKHSFIQPILKQIYAVVALVNWLQQKYNTPMFNTWLHLLESEEIHFFFLQSNRLLSCQLTNNIHV